MARLPTSGADDGAWGDILNSYLQVSHATDGTLKPGVVDSSALQNNSVSGTKLQDNSVTNAKLDVNSGSDGQVLTRDSGTTGGFTWTSVAGSPDATSSTKGLVQLAGDLSGTASAPTVPALDGKVAVANGGGETYFDAGNSGTAITLNLANGNVQKLTLTGNCTITLTSPASGAFRSLLLYVFQDATGSRSITWPGSVKWGTAGAPVLSTAATKMDKILLDTVDGGTTWYGSAGPGGF